MMTKRLIESSLCLVVLTFACTPVTHTEDPLPEDMTNDATGEENTSPDDPSADETSADVVDGQGVQDGQSDGTDQPDSGEPATEDVAGESDSNAAVDEPTLSVAEATEAATLAARVFAITGTSVAAAKAVEPALHGGGSLPLCPSIDLAVQSQPMGLTLDYGAGCAVSSLPAVVLSGIVEGDYFGANAISLTATDLSDGVLAIDGTVAGGFTSNGSVTTYQLTINMASESWPSIGGGGTMELDQSTGQVTVSLGSFTLRDNDDEVYSVEIEQATFDTNEGGGLTRASGSGRVTKNSSPDANASTIEVDLSSGMTE